MFLVSPVLHKRVTQSHWMASMIRSCNAPSMRDCTWRSSCTVEKFCTFFFLVFCTIWSSSRRVGLCFPSNSQIVCCFGDGFRQVLSFVLFSSPRFRLTNDDYERPVCRSNPSDRTELPFRSHFALALLEFRKNFFPQLIPFVGISDVENEEARGTGDSNIHDIDPNRHFGISKIFIRIDTHHPAGPISQK